MAQLGVRVARAAVQATIEEDATANAGADGYVDEALRALARAPGELTQGGRVSVIFDGDRHAKSCSHAFDGIHAFPERQEAVRPEHTRARVDWAGAARTDPGQARSRAALQAALQHILYLG